ncbi:MAG: aminotransferase class I/II-fold pyridoxal phosphate-dependent enzyme, partial [Oscillospiraceae bacterium]|nr:aminotransferase class I/II-fold pyridoxal phosphate-dependent enzyme [Oscillospiraceae bacterium]
MPCYREMTPAQLKEELSSLQSAFAAKKALGLSLDMSRGKPSPEQLDLSMGMLDVIGSGDSLVTDSGIDVRNYGQLEGIPEARELFADMMGVQPDEVFICGNSSLNMMYDTVSRGMVFGFPGGDRPWGKQEKLKFLCPAPGYDRHFAICEVFGIQMITIPMTPTGPDMNLVESWVNNDDTVKGIWCVPQYSNPEGITYSDETVRRFANLKPAAGDFRIFWDNAYCVHHLTDHPDHLLNLMDECKKVGSEDMVIMFSSTSKISFSGAGVAAIGCSRTNMEALEKVIAMQIISFDKINQLRHVRFFKNLDGIKAHMEKHKALLAPRFEIVLSTLQRELNGLDVARWTNPNGGYFVSVDTMDGCAARTVALCKEAGVKLTNAGATFPYGTDPHDRNIRIAPSYPS